MEAQGRPIEITVETDVLKHRDPTPTTDFPAPISADPTVPDPASVVGSPISPVESPASPIIDSEIPTASKSLRTSSENMLDTKGYAMSLLKNGVAHSASGLFTPLTEGHSGSSAATPEMMIEPGDVDNEDADADGEDVEAGLEEVSPGAHEELHPSGVAESIPRK